MVKPQTVSDNNLYPFLFHQFPYDKLTHDILSHFVLSVESLLEAGAITKSKLGIHKIVVGREDFTAKDLTVQAHAFTASAREAIESNGGKCQLLKRTTGEVIEETA